jgi:sugar lactone lactonase YvrE
MIKNLTSLFATILVFLIFSCKNDQVSPNPNPTKPEETTIDKSLLTGWWAPLEKGKPQIYFGADNFFYLDTTMVKSPYTVSEPIPGFWHLSGPNIQYSATQNGTVSTTYNVVTLTSNSLVIKNGVTSNAYVKTNLPAITSPPISTVSFEQNGGSRGIITDKAGNIYYCDDSYNVVRKISAADGKSTIIAGTGKTTEYKPFVDNSPATSVDLKTPSGLAIDDAGNIYVSEAVILNGRVDKITPDGKISRIAGSFTLPVTGIGDGGLALDAHLHEPVGLALDAAGNLYIADLQNYRIRKISAADHKITTVAGNGLFSNNGSKDGIISTSSEVSPLFLSVDADNNIYFSDMFSGRIRKVTASTGMISTIARDIDGTNGGNGSLVSEVGIGSPWGFCMAANGDIYFIGDFISVKKIDKKTNIVTKIAGNGYSGFTGDGLHATAYSLSIAYQVAVDNSGNVYIADGNRIRKIKAK